MNNYEINVMDLLDELEDEDLASTETYAQEDESLHEQLADNLLDNMDNVSDCVLEDLAYPFIEVHGLEKMFEIEYVKRTLDKEEQTPTSIPVVIRVEDNLHTIGNMNININSFIKVLALKRYDLTLHQSEEENFPMDMKFLETLI